MFHTGIAGIHSRQNTKQGIPEDRKEVGRQMNARQRKKTARNGNSTSVNQKIIINYSVTKKREVVKG